jgi:hypothetical protein
MFNSLKINAAMMLQGCFIALAAWCYQWCCACACMHSVVRYTADDGAHMYACMQNLW